MVNFKNSDIIEHYRDELKDIIKKLENNDFEDEDDFYNFLKIESKLLDEAIDHDIALKIQFRR